MSVWEEVRALIDAGDADKVAARVAELDRAERREVARELPGHIAAAREAAHRATAEKEQRLLVERVQAMEMGQEEFDRYAAERGLLREDRRLWAGNLHHDWLHGAGPGTRSAERDAWIDPMRAAGAGTIESVTAVISWLNRRDFDRWGSPADAVGPVARAVAARPAEWRADLAVRLALKVRGVRGDVNWYGDPVDRHLPPALELFRQLGTAPPEHDPLVVGWVTMTPDADRLREDPLLDVLVPRIFQAEGTGRALREERADPLAPDSWLGVLHALAAEGRISRQMLLSGCAGRFLRGGDAADLRFFARLHELLEPSAAEAAARARDYLRLLPVAPGPVAELALRHLRRLDADPAGTAAGAAPAVGGASGRTETVDAAEGSGALEPLDAAEVVEALEGLLFRAEGGLVRDGLAWLEERLKADPERADGLVPALAPALGHQARAVQERAVRLAVRHAAAFTPPGARTLREATGQLPPDLHNRMAAAFGGELRQEPEPEPEPEEVLQPRAIPTLSPPVAFLATPERPEEVAALYGAQGWIAAERFLAGFVRCAVRDAEGLREALAETRRRGMHRSPQLWSAALVSGFLKLGADRVPEPAAHSGDLPLARVVRTEEPAAQIVLTGEPSAAQSTPAGEFPAGPVTVPPGALRRGAHAAWQVLGPGHLIRRRQEEILAALRDGALPPLLLATPTLTTGHLDPAELVARLERLEEAGAEPLLADLTQALLRLPRTADPGAAARAAGLTSAAGREAARRLAGMGLPDPEVAVRWFCSPEAQDEQWRQQENPAGHWLDEREPDGPLTPRQVMAVVTITPSGNDATTGPAEVTSADDAVTGSPEASPADGAEIGPPEASPADGTVTASAGTASPERRAGDDGPGGDRLAAAVAELVATLVASPVTGPGPGPAKEDLDWWPSVMPSHREVVAAHMLPFRRWDDRGDGFAQQRLPNLALLQGPTGQATALLLAERLVMGLSTHPSRALLHLAATGALPAADLGADLGRRLRRFWITLGAVRSILNDAVRQGAVRDAWTMTAAILPAALPAPGERPRKALLEFFVFARKLAGWAGARGEIPEITAVAARRGGNPFLQECRCLHGLLTRP
ncbi:hypothetical protein [Planobispora takensis]|uniref:Secreted protein n=1 Tax=Planobispora takensis TaxID=1367882 RepID=A0A8J3ST66_9ACTN|nr:hypothetical protein [Planobispora takensis]GII00194.1 hypothetical protein Pta02_22020 [Planobispora takensis]